MAVKENIYLYLENKGVTPTKAERDLGWGVGALTKAKSITADRLKEFILLYSDASPDWLLTGKGEMLKSYPPQGNNEENLIATNRNLSETVRNLSETIKLLSKK